MPYTVWMTKPHSWPGAHTRSRVDQLDGTNLTPSARHVLHHPSSPVGWWCFYLVSCILQKVYSVPCIHCTIFYTIAHQLARAPLPLPLYDTILYDIMYYKILHKKKQWYHILSYIFRIMFTVYHIMHHSSPVGQAPDHFLSYMSWYNILWLVIVTLGNDVILCSPWYISYCKYQIYSYTIAHGLAHAPVHHFLSYISWYNAYILILCVTNYYTR